MTYKIELVTMDAPYIALGYVKNTSIINGRLEFCRNKKDALMVTNNITYEMVKKLIKKHNNNGVRVMSWITEKDGNKRIFEKDIRW